MSPPAASVTLQVQGQPSVEQLTLGLNELDGVLEVTTLDLAETADEPCAKDLPTNSPLSRNASKWRWGAYRPR